MASLLGKVATGAGNLLTGGAISAGREQRKGINKAMTDVRTGYGAGIGNINQGFDQAQEQLDSGFGKARTDLSGGMATARSALQPLASQSAGAYSGLLGGYNEGAFDPTKFNFKEDPGFQFALNKGLDSLRGGNERLGLRGSGQEQKDILDYATGAASQQYGDAFNRNAAAVGQNFGQGMSLASPAFGLAGQLSNLFAQEGQGLSDLSSQSGMQGAGLSTNRAGLLSGLNTEQGVNLANLNLGKGQVNAGIQQAGWSPVTQAASQLGGKLLGGFDPKMLSGLLKGSSAPGGASMAGGLTDPRMLSMLAGVA